jgi:hypothetical protein
MKESSIVGDLTIKYIPTFVQHANIDEAYELCFRRLFYKITKD